MPAILMLLLAAATVDPNRVDPDGADLDEEVEQFISEAVPRFSRYDANFSIQFNFWMAVARGTSTIDGTDFNLRTELDVGVLNHAYEGLLVPSIGAAVGGLTGVLLKSPELAVAGFRYGGFVAVVLTPFIIQAPLDVVAQYNYGSFGVRTESFFLRYDNDPDDAVPYATFEASQIRAMAMWTFHETRDRDSGVAWSLLLGFAWVSSETSVEPTSGGDVSVVLPQIGFLFEARTGPIGYEIQIAGGGLDDDTWVDGRVAFMYSPSEVYGFRIGYRYVVADLSSGNYRWNGSLDGFYFGVSFHF
jgi:hypothetical protein